MQGTLSVSIWRGGEAGSFQPYEVPRRDNQTVLDVVTYVQRRLDASLSYRFACRVGMCGSCAMMVNGRPRWTCRTHVSRVASSGKLTIAPLRNLPVIKDLSVDMTGFFDKWARAGGAFKPTATRADDFAAIRPADPKRRHADEGIECIGCAICYAACDVVAWRPGYLGPAALNRAWTSVNDVRYAGGAGMPSAVARHDGRLGGHSHHCCKERCRPLPNPPAASVLNSLLASPLDFLLFSC